jgi:hypothetical protein
VTPTRAAPTIRSFDVRSTILNGHDKKGVTAEIELEGMASWMALRKSAFNI